METKNHLGCFYYPSTALIVDDSENFLDQLSLEFGSELIYKLVNNPATALSLVEKNKKYSIKNFLVEDLDSTSYGLNQAEHCTKINLSQLYHKVYDAERFREISVVVVDYSMPAIDGYEFCQKVSAMSFKKIMLTGEADDALAVQLFNNNLLSKFLKKERQNLGSELNKLIIEEQKCYFFDRSRSTIENLKVSQNFHFANHAVQKVFHEFCVDNHIVEYYMINSNGSCLLLDFYGRPFWFVLVDELELNDFLDIAEDQRASSEILKLLKTKQKIPFFPLSTNFMDAQDDRWSAYLHSAQKISSDKDYYCAFVRDRNLLDLDLSKILSLSAFLDQNDQS